MPLGSCPTARSGVRDGHQEHAALVPPCCPRPGTAVACGACQVRPACSLQARACKYGGTKDVSCPRVLLAEQELLCLVCCPAGRRGQSPLCLGCAGLSLGSLCARPACCSSTSTPLPALSAPQFIARVTPPDSLLTAAPLRGTSRRGTRLTRSAAGGRTPQAAAVACREVKGLLELACDPLLLQSARSGDRGVLAAYL